MNSSKVRNQCSVRGTASEIIAIYAGHLINSQFQRAPLQVDSLHAYSLLKNAEEKCSACFLLQFLDEQLLLAMNAFNKENP